MPQQHTHCALSALSLSDRHNSDVLTCHSRSRSLNIARHTSRTVTYLKSATAPPSATKTRQPLRQRHTFVLSPWQDGRQLTNTTINCLWLHVLHSRVQLLDQLSILQHRKHCSTPGACHLANSLNRGGLQQLHLISLDTSVVQLHIHCGSGPSRHIQTSLHSNDLAVIHSQPDYTQQ